MQSANRVRSSGVRRAIALLAGGGLLAGVLPALPAAADGNAVVYWQCVPISSTRPNGGYCPVGDAYPLPTQGSTSGTPTAENLAQVNGATVNVGAGAAGTGTQRVTTSTDSTIGTLTGGGVASGAADSGNPVKVGGVYNSSVQTVTTGQRVDVQSDSHGHIATVPANSDGTLADTTAAVPVVSSQDVPNGATQVQASTSAANTINTATLAAQSGKTNYVCQVTFTAGGSTTGLAVAPTITGLLGGTMTMAFVFPTGAIVGASYTKAFPKCFPASAANVAIAAILPAGGAGNTQAAVTIEGFYQ